MRKKITRRLLMAAGAAGLATKSTLAGTSRIEERRHGREPTGVFDVISFGAVGDGRTDCAVAIHKAIDETARFGLAVAC